MTDPGKHRIECTVLRNCAAAKRRPVCPNLGCGSLHRVCRILAFNLLCKQISRILQALCSRSRTRIALFYIFDDSAQQISAPSHLLKTCNVRQGRIHIDDLVRQAQCLHALLIVWIQAKRPLKFVPRGEVIPIAEVSFAQPAVGFGILRRLFHEILKDAGGHR